MEQNQIVKMQQFSIIYFNFGDQFRLEGKIPRTSLFRACLNLFDDATEGRKIRLVKKKSPIFAAISSFDR